MNSSRVLRSSLAFILLVGFSAGLTGCNDAGKGAFLGSGLGAGLGAIIGHQSGHGGEGALIGAGAGALLGYIAGNESDKNRHQSYHDYYGPHGTPVYDETYTTRTYRRPVYRSYYYAEPYCPPYYRSYYHRPYRSSISFTFSDCPW